MAVVQISKIQIRRGQKNSSSGVPQLSSAELAWAVDTQELYIGNGSVQEGAPYVGNTKVLTEHDNILELANSYRFSSDDPAITLSQPRTLLGKVDEIEVSVIDYGAVPDGSTSANEAFVNAFTELFRNTDDTYKKVLKVPNGEYLFTTDLEIPSNVILRGETQSGTKLKIDTTNIRFITSEGTGLISFTSSDRPENVKIENLTIERSSGQTVISGLKDSTFENVTWKGEYQLSTPSSSINLATVDSAVFWNNSIAGIKVDGIKFKGCRFESNAVSVKCSQTIATDTKVDFQGCEFFINDTSINVIGVDGQANNWQIKDCEFNEVSRYVFNSNWGSGTKFIGSSFTNCGNSTNTAANPVWPMISFGETTDNIVTNCFSNRQQSAGIVSSETITGISGATDLIAFISSEIYLGAVQLTPQPTR